MKLFATAADPTKPVGEEEGCKPDGMRPTPIGEGTGFRCGHRPQRFVHRSTPCATLHVPDKRRDMCRSMCTNTYQLSFLEVPSGLKIILITSPGAGDLRSVLQEFYEQLFVGLVAKDPAAVPGDPIDNPAFEQEVVSFIRAKLQGPL